MSLRVFSCDVDFPTIMNEEQTVCFRFCLRTVLPVEKYLQISALKACTCESDLQTTSSTEVKAVFPLDAGEKPVR